MHSIKDRKDFMMMLFKDGWIFLPFQRCKEHSDFYFFSYIFLNKKSVVLYRGKQFSHLYRTDFSIQNAKIHFSLPYKKLRRFSIPYFSRIAKTSGSKVSKTASSVVSEGFGCSTVFSKAVSVKINRCNKGN
jgi:hypothetical protein